MQTINHKPHPQTFSRAGNPTKVDAVTSYARGVALGLYPAGKLVRWACERHLSDLERADLCWHPRIVDRVDKFFNYLYHYKGELAGTPIALEPWQLFCVGSVFGWYYPDGRRRFNEAYIEIARGNGKTTMAAGVALYGLTFDSEPGPEVYTLATKEAQAKLCFRDAKVFVKKSGPLRTMVDPFQKELRCEQNEGIMRPLGSDSDTLDGLNVHVAVCDELHAWKSGDLYRVVKDSLAKRKRGLMYSITTAGLSDVSFCKDVRDKCVNMLDPAQPDFKDDRFFPYVCELDNPKDWENPKVWVQANPNMGVSISEVDFAEDLAKCEQPPATPFNFKVKRLNIWSSSEESDWFPMQSWLDSTIPQEPDLSGRRCIFTLDLSDVSDLTALGDFYPSQPNRAAFWRVHFYCPEVDIVKRSKNGVPYDKWCQQGFITATPGPVTDRRYIERDILANWKKHNPEVMVYDPHMATDISIQLTEMHGLKLEIFRPNNQNMNPALLETKRLIKEGGILHTPNPVMDWCCRNVVVTKGPTGSLKLDKSKAKDKIDGVAALVYAVGYSLGNMIRESFYGSRCLRTLRK